jgi:hypothetical protein
MVLGKAPESHVQDGKKLLRCASCATATASGDPAMTIKSLRLAAGTWARPGLPGSAIASRTLQKTNATKRSFGNARMQPAFASTSTGDAAKPADCKNARRLFKAPRAKLV